MGGGGGEEKGMQQEGETQKKVHRRGKQQKPNLPEARKDEPQKGRQTMRPDRHQRKWKPKSLPRMPCYVWQTGIWVLQVLEGPIRNRYHPRWLEIQNVVNNTPYIATS